jgi:hypothetical protein
MAMEGARGREFPQLVPNHLLRDEDRDEFFTIVDRKGQSPTISGTMVERLDQVLITFPSFNLRASSTFLNK